MTNEHNPIAQLVNKIQQKWIEEISPHPHIKLVRWLIKPDQAELYEGFLKLESSIHGSINEVPIVLLSHFEDAARHSKKLAQDWINAFEKDEEFQKSLKKNNLKFDWNYKAYQKELTSSDTDANILLMEMLATFQKNLPNPELPLVLTLFPYSISDTEGYELWIKAIMEIKLPDKVRLMVFDYAEERHFENTMKKYPKTSKSLAVSLDLEGAIAQLASAGNQNDPIVQFRRCMAEMSKCTVSKDIEGLHKWGGRGVDIMRKTRQKSNYSTAHIIYASMLLNFKKHEKIEQLSRKALNIAKNGHQLGDDNCKALIVQSYGLLASNKQLEKKQTEASKLFCLQAEQSIKLGFEDQALTAWWLAYSAIRKKDKSAYNDIVQKAYKHGLTLDEEVLKASCMRYIAADYHRLSEQNGEENKCKSIDDFMIGLIGEGWKVEVEQNQKQMKKLSIPKLF